MGQKPVIMNPSLVSNYGNSYKNKKDKVEIIWRTDNIVDEFEEEPTVKNDCRFSIIGKIMEILRREVFIY